MDEDELPEAGATDGSGVDGAVLTVTLRPETKGARLDKALYAALQASETPDPGLSRSRLRALIEMGAVSLDGREERDAACKVGATGAAIVRVPAPRPIEPQPEPIPLDIHYEDAALIVVDKPVGMAVHPAPGAQSGTLVNALLAHCGAELSGVGGALRPGIVHRIDKETSGLLVVAKSDRAHQGLARQFAEHSVERAYMALCWSAPDRGDPRLAGHPATSFEGDALKIDAPIGRHRTDRKRMAVIGGGRRAVTRAWTRERFGSADAPLAARLECRLETGRTHQIRVHLAHVGHPLLGDPVYGRPRVVSERAASEACRHAIAAFPRQALHAARLGFTHPITGETHAFESAPPDDLAALLAALRAG